MARRVIEDGRGRRWEVRDAGGPADGSPREEPAAPGGTIVFRDPDSGLEYQTSAPRRLDETTDEQLRDELREVRLRADGPSIGTGRIGRREGGRENPLA